MISGNGEKKKSTVPGVYLFLPTFCLFLLHHKTTSREIIDQTIAIHVNLIDNVFHVQKLETLGIYILN
jgi:hypothetical protein